jgi:hypothetical protein
MIFFKNIDIQNYEIFTNVFVSGLLTITLDILQQQIYNVFTTNEFAKEI